MEAPNSRCASPPKQNMSTLSHHVAALSASSAVSDPPPHRHTLFLQFSKGWSHTKGPTFHVCQHWIARPHLSFSSHIFIQNMTVYEVLNFIRCQSANRGRSDVPICCVTQSSTEPPTRCRCLYPLPISRSANLWQTFPAICSVSESLFN